MLREKDKKELKRRASIIREGADLEARVESFISKHSHPNHRSNDSALDELASDIIKLLSKRKSLAGHMEGFESALSKLTAMVKDAEVRENGSILGGDAQQRFLVRYIIALSYRISYNVILHQAGFVSYRFVRLTRSSDLDVVSKKATIVSKFPLGFFSREKEEIDFRENTFETYKAEWQVLRAIIFRANTTLVPFDTKQLEGIEWLHRLNTTIAGHLDWVAQFEEDPDSLIRLDQGTQFLTMVSNSGALKSLLYQGEDPEELGSYSGMQRIFELRERANLGKPISINDYLVARAEYIMNYARAKRVNFVFYSLWEGIKKLQRDFPNGGFIKEVLQKAQLHDIPQHRLKLDADGSNTRAQHSPKVFMEEGDVLFQLLFNKRPADLLALQREFHKVK